MAQGDANKVWMIPSDFSKSLEGFARMLGTKGDDGVFRYEPSNDPIPESRPGEMDDDVKDWFGGTSPDEVAQAVREAEQEAAISVDDRDALMAPIKPILPSGPAQLPPSMPAPAVLPAGPAPQGVPSGGFQRPPAPGGPAGYPGPAPYGYPQQPGYPPPGGPAPHGQHGQPPIGEPGRPPQGG